MNRIFKLLGIDEVYTVGIKKSGNVRHDIPRNIRLCDYEFIPVSGRFWYADPLFFEGCLFVEMYDRHRDIGGIGVIDLNVRPWKPKLVISEPFHMSFPEVFRIGDGIFMIPETGKTRKMYIYRCRRFPYEWERYQVIDVGRQLADSIVIEHMGKRCIVTSCLTVGGGFLTVGCLYELIFKKGDFFIKEVKSDCADITRNAGNVFYVHGKPIRPAQVCTRSRYGIGLSFRELSMDDKMNVKEREVSRVMSDDIRGITGIHTYSVSEDGKMQAIDIRYLKWRPFFALHIWKNRISSRIGRRNK